MVKEGELAPDFTLPSDQDEQVTLSSFRGKKVVVYFYPKDDTPGCTKEACSFRDANSLFMAKGAVVIGISPDDATSHQRFRAKHGLPFHLLSDTDHQVAEAYGAWARKRCTVAPTRGSSDPPLWSARTGRSSRRSPR